MVRLWVRVGVGVCGRIKRLNIINSSLKRVGKKLHVFEAVRNSAITLKPPANNFLAPACENF